MARVYRRDCGWCGKYYESWAEKFCSNSCSSFYKHSIKDYGFIKNQPAWNKGKKLHYSIWNKGTKGVVKAKKTSFKKGHIPWHKGKRFLSGARHPRWKGGKKITTQGYSYIWIGRNKHTLEHRYIMEQSLGRKLHRYEHVHHINGDKLDNRLANLKLIKAKDHSKLHAIKMWSANGVRR